MPTPLPPNSPVVLITGCSHGGIGFSLCEEFAAKGCTVYASARRLEAMSSFTHPSIRPLTMDVTSDASVQKAVEKVIEEVGRVDIVVANAGVACFGPVLEVPIEQVKQTFDTNVLGVLRLAQQVFPYMATRKRGTFVTIGSVVGSTPTPWTGVYAGSKAAVHAITETLQMEARALSPDIKVTLVLTGGVRSNVVNNTKFALPPASLYTRYLPNILARIQMSQVEPMATTKFAQSLVNGVLRRGGAPGILALGAHTLVFKILRLLPKGLVMWYLWKRMATLKK